jgi:hypothetical protein
MGLIGGIVLLAVGIGLVILALPRRGEDIRPFLKFPLAQVLYPSICLVLLSMGAAVILTNLP